MRLDGSLRVCGLIGNPVAHTISPLLQSVLAERMNINSVYAPFHVEKENLETDIANDLERIGELKNGLR